MQAMSSSHSQQPLGEWISKAKAALGRYRLPLFAAALALFATGLWWSTTQLSLDWSDLDPLLLLIVALILAPMGIIYGALNFMVMARGADLQIPFWSAFKTTCIAQFAAVLPLPGAMLVRGGAMMARGSSVGGAASHVTANALLWIACAGIAAGLSLTAITGSVHPVSFAILIGGTLGAGLCTFWLARVSSLGLAMGVLTLRFAGVALSGLRLTAAFAAIGMAIPYAEAFPFAFANIVGNASAIAPAGLGISEGLAAAIATLSGITSAAAFLAVGINRIIGIAVSGILTGIISLGTSKPSNTTEEL